MRKLAVLAAVSLGLSSAACDSQAENQVEETATAIDESYEAEADIVESIEQGGPNEAAAEAQADALRDEGEEIKDDLEDAADDMDAAPQ